MNVTNEIKPNQMDVCRACMCKGENINMLSIFEFATRHPTKILISELLTTTIPQLIQIKENDALSKIICVQCLDKLLTLHQFQQMCLRTEKHMLSKLGSEKTELHEIAEMSSLPLVNDSTSDPLQNDFAAIDDGTSYVKLEAEDYDILESEERLNGTASSEISKSNTINKKTSEYQQATQRNITKRSSGINHKNRKTNSENSDVNVTPEVITVQPCLENLTSSVEGPKELFNEKESVRKRIKKKRAGTITKQQKQKSFVCKVCDKAFHQSCTLKEHVRIHTGEQPFLCSECGKAFNSSSNLKQHLLRHTGEKRYECPDCPKKFPCLSDLASHKAVHKKLKPHTCDTCGAAFGKPFQLKKHKMYHNNDRPHKCEFCEMRFVCADHMRRHIRTHTGEKPYKCKYCDRAFAQSNDLIKHLRTHLGENVYKCQLCPQSFRLATALREHFTIHKNEDDETRERNLKALLEEEQQLKINLSKSGGNVGDPNGKQRRSNT